MSPLFWYDLARTGKQGRLFLFRALYALGQLGMLYWTCQERLNPDGRVGPQQLAELGEAFFARYLLLQGLAVAVLVPPYVGGAVAAEKHRGTLDLLLTTHLTDAEIVIGLLFARLALVAQVLLAGVPVVALALLFGGINPGQVAAAVPATAAVLLLAGGLAVNVAVRELALLGNVLASTFLLLATFLPFWLLAAMAVVIGDQPETWFVIPFLLGVLLAPTVRLVAEAARSLRPRYQEQRGRPAPAPVPPAQPLRPAVVVGDAPMLWKDVWRDPASPLRPEGLAGCVLTVTLMVAPLALGAYAVRSEAGPWLTGLTLAALALAVGCRAAGGVAREFERGTAESLLVTPLTAAEVLTAKGLRALLPAQAALPFVLLIWLAAWLLRGLAWPALLLLPFLAVTAVGTAAALGLVLGAWCRSAARAQLLTAAAVLLLTLPLGPWPGIFGMAQTFAKTPRDLDSIHPWRQAEWLQRMALSLYGLASLAALGVMAWAWALRQWDPRTSGGVHPRRPPSPPG